MPVLGQKQTSVPRQGMSAMDHKRTWQQSFLQTDYTNDYRSDIGVSPAFTITA